MYKYFIEFKNGTRTAIALFIGTREELMQSIINPLHDSIEKYGIVPANQNFLNSDLEIVITKP